MAHRKRTQTTTSERRASIRLAAGKLKNPNTPAAANNGTVDAISLTTVVAAIHTPIRNGATYRYSTFRTIVITPPLQKILA